MPSKRRHSPPRRDATRRLSTPRHDVPHAQDEPLIADLREAMRTPGGVALLGFVGGVVEATRQDRPSLLQEAPPVDLPGLVESFVDIDIAETTAALHVIAAYVEDELLRTRIRRVLAGRRQPMPELVVGIADLHVTRAWRFIFARGDIDHIVLDLSVTASVLVQIDCNAGIVSDAFAVPISGEEALARMRENAPEGSEIVGLSLADARARLEDPIDLGDIMLHAPETDTWPASRPLLRMLCRDLPEGGTGYPMDAADADLGALTRAVLATHAAGQLDDTPGSQDADIVHTILWLTGFLGFFEPLRWSAERAEAMLLDLVPRKVLADAAYLRRVPEVFRALVRASVELGHTSGWVADEALEAIEEMTPEFLEDISGPPRQPGDGAHRLALEVLATNPEAAARRLAVLEEIMGSATAVAALDLDALEALVDRPLDVDDAPSPVRDAAVAVDAFAASAIHALFPEDVAGEYRAAVRTLVERLVAVDPDTLRRGKPANTAAALCWAVGRANDLIGESSGADSLQYAMEVGPEAARRHPEPDPVPVKELFADLGVSGNVTTRAGGLLERLGYTPTWVDGSWYALGDPTLLTSEKRRRVALARNRWAPALE